ncbi:hypothetical protein B0T10DRAFT_581962 [Thelonectria olida]|uniref:NmrA-like domain-containing protein n=1 Tax=Thelonectria olida TaxID=1576542 RepID=A0A9P8VUJ6_9HYPO|nr:hypothetical protein B0T10DRAFT_581962 [Thelonectria olida]
MPAHITIVPASTQAGKETVLFLLASKSKPFVRGIYRDPSKAPTEFTQHPNFEAVKGDVGSGAGLDFSGSNAVMYIPPPTYDGTDQGQFATQTALNVKKALQNAPNVTRLLLHSSMGAQHDHGIGILRLNHISDNVLKHTVPEVLVVRPAYFYENWADALKTMQADPPRLESPIPLAEYQIPMVSAKDVGEYFANALLEESAKPGLQHVDLYGPRHYSSLDVKKAIEDVTGKEGELVNIERDALSQWYEKHVPKVYAQEFADMILGALPGGVMEHFDDQPQIVRGKTELGDAMREMAFHSG